MDLYLIRHAQSANNAQPESLRVPDPSLTGLGREQAHLLASSVASLGLTRLMTSTSARSDTRWEATVLSFWLRTTTGTLIGAIVGGRLCFDVAVRMRSAISSAADVGCR